MTWRGHTKLWIARHRPPIIAAVCAVGIWLLVFVARTNRPLSCLYIVTIPVTCPVERLVLCFCWRQKPPENFGFCRRHLHSYELPIATVAVVSTEKIVPDRRAFHLIWYTGIGVYAQVPLHLCTESLGKKVVSILYATIQLH